MKSLHQKLSGIAPFILFPLLIVLRKRKKTAYLLVLLVLISLCSCYRNFYKTNTTPSIDAATMERLKSEDKYFIVHSLNSINGLEQVSINGDTLHGKLVALSAEHSRYLYPSSPIRSRFKKVDKKNALVEVHLYTKEILKGDSMLTMSLSSINKADVYELNKSATNTNHILSTIGFSVAGLYVVGLVAILIACNCPQVYVDNNGQYDFKSGLYSGAVYSTLERMDYLPLTGIPADAKDISFKIANAKNEEQFINKVELLQVNHLPNVNVLADRHGNIFSYSTPLIPLSALSDGKNDIKNVLIKTDEVYYSFDNKQNEDGFSDLLLKFNKPQNTNKAKLIIHGRNTYWGGLLHKDFINLFGNNFEKWKDKQEKANPKKLEKWQTDQALPLMVYLKTPTGWKFIDYFPLIGNTATRDMIMEINTDAVLQDTIELKLETAYRFWDLDFAGIDYSANDDFKTTVLEPERAITSDSADQKNNLRSNDNQYTHLTGDQSIYFKYEIPPSSEKNVSSYFLASGGYYHNLEHITGKTNYRELYKFKKKGAFDRFSRQEYQQAQDVAEILKGTNK